MKTKNLNPNALDRLRCLSFNSKFVLTLLCLVVVALACKKEHSNELKENLKLLESTKSWYSKNVKETKVPNQFLPDWENFLIDGDSLLIVKTKGLSQLEGIENGSKIGTVSGLIFSLKKGRVQSERVVQFFGNDEKVKSSSLNIIASYNKNGIVANGIFIQYSPKYYRQVGGYTIENGVANHDKRPFIKRGSNLTENKMLTNIKSGSLKSSTLMYDGRVCDNIYYVVYDLRTGVVISYTFLYKSCEGRDEDNPDDDGTPPENSGNPEVNLNPCQQLLSEADAIPDSETTQVIDAEDNGDTRVKMYSWTFLRNKYDWWSYSSLEKGTHKKVGDEWQWLSLEHIKIGRDGMTPAADITVSDVHMEPTLGVYYAGATLFYNFKAKVLCDGKYNPLTGYDKVLHSNSESWYSND